MKLNAPARKMLRYPAGRPGQTAELAAGIQAEPGNSYWYGVVKALRVAGLVEEGCGTYRICGLLW